MSSTTTPQGTSRLAGVDAFRVLAAFAVVAGHGFSNFKVLPEVYSDSILPELYFLLHDLTHWAVPFFLVASGYFLAKSVMNGAAPWPLLRLRCLQLGVVFVAWSILYRSVPEFIREFPTADAWTAPLEGTVEVLADLATRPFHLLFGEGAEHLWFVPALIGAWAIIVTLHSAGRSAYIVPLGIAAYVFVLMTTTYRATPIGLETFMTSRNNPLFCLIFSGLGWRLAFSGRLPTLRTGAWFALGGLVLAQAEVFLLVTHFGMGYSSRAYFGTVPITFGLLVVSLNLPEFGARIGLARLGRLTLGIYLIHLLLFWELERFKYSVPPLVWDLGIDLTVFLLAAVITWVLLRNPWTAALVSGFQHPRRHRERPPSGDSPASKPPEAEGTSRIQRTSGTA